MSDLSKLDYLLHKGPYTQGPSSTKILGLNKFRFISSLSKITDQVWFSNNSAKETRQKKRAVEWRLEATEQGVGLDQIRKRRST